MDSKSPCLDIATVLITGRVLETTAIIAAITRISVRPDEHHQQKDTVSGDADGTA